MESCSINCMNLMRSPSHYVKSSVMEQKASLLLGAYEIGLAILNIRDAIKYPLDSCLLKNKKFVLLYGDEDKLAEYIMTNVMSSVLHSTYGVFFLCVGLSQNQILRWNDTINPRCAEFCDEMVPVDPTATLKPQACLGECFWNFNTTPYVSDNLSNIAISFMALTGIVGLAKTGYGIGALLHRSITKVGSETETQVTKPFPAKRILLSGLLDLCGVVSMGILAYAAIKPPETPLGNFEDSDSAPCEVLCDSIVTK